MQMRLASYFVAMAAFAVFFQVFLTDHAIATVIGTLPNDRAIARALLPTALDGGLYWTLAVVVPLMVTIGALVTFRVAGPATRLQLFFERLANGESMGPCRLRDHDDLQVLCAATNRALARVNFRSISSRSGMGDRTESGFAIIVALVTIVILASTILTAVMSFQSHSTQVERRGEDYELEVAVESATDLAIHEIWSRFHGTVMSGVNPDSVEGFRDYLSSIGANDQAGVANPVGYDVLATLGLDFDADGTKELSNVTIDELRLVRVDNANDTEVRLTATVSGRSNRAAGPNAAGWKRSIETTFMVEPDLWGGLEFALLANNVNCVLCHTTVDSTERYYAAGGSGPYSRIKVGTLERLMMRDNADSQILGTLYSGGPITDKSGVAISPSDWASHTLRSVQLDSDGKVVEDVSGNPVSAPMVPADGDTEENGRLYENYDATSMVDGELPATFPPPFPDDGGIDPLTDDPTPTVGNGNRMVDDNEYYAATKEFHGTISGGQIFVLDPADSIVSNADLTVAMTTSNKTSLTSNTSGQVFLTGTAANPIQLNGSVAIDGNLVIRGYVKGNGQIWVRGNAYAPTDVQYLDGDVSGNRTYGTASDGTENLLVLTTGGNVLIGDPTLPNSLNAAQASFVQMELATFNRNEWVKTQPTLPGASGTVTNLAYDPTYVPRYYAMTNGEPIGIFSNTGRGWFDATGEWHGEEHPQYWSSTWLDFADPSDPLDPILYDASGNPKAEILYVTGANSWIADAQLTRMFDLMNTGRSPDPLQIDMFAYTNNAIFGITSAAHGNTGGKIRVNGGIVAADVGLLATEGIQLNYDRRAAQALRIQGNESVTIRRSSSAILR
ncbi:MAG: hypothetical protein KDB80_17975 [Planctomycetes bacterium]|nr:hypothetical protein [Planctomycetota bacterium]